jgi:hypothetical protein
MSHPPHLFSSLDQAGEEDVEEEDVEENLMDDSDDDLYPNKSTRKTKSDQEQGKGKGKRRR